MAGLYLKAGENACFVTLTARSASQKGARLPLLLYADQAIRWLESTDQADLIRESGCTVRLSCRGIKLRA